MEENETRIVNFDRICRLCLNEKRLLMEIFESSLDNNNLTIDQKIMACASIDLTKDDGLPTRICVKCLSSVNAAFEFRLQCENADKTLHEIHNLLLTNESDVEKKDKLVLKDNKKGECQAEEFQVEEVVEDLNHIIVIKQEEKDIMREQKMRNQLYIINNLKEEEEESREGVSGDNVIYFNHGEITSDNSLGSPSFQTEESKEDCEMPSEISFSLQDNEQESYKVVIIPPDESQEMTKLKVTKKTSSDTPKKSPCPFCNKMLARVEEHIRLLHRNKVYVCTKNNCGAEFLTLKNLQSHQLRCYEMEKTYKCPSCFKDFHRKSNLKAHVKRHADKKDFQCQLCERAFVDSTGLRRHFLKHHEPEQEVFVSGCCGKRFKSKEGLKKHIRNGICGIHIFQISDSDEASFKKNESVVCIQEKNKNLEES